MYSLIAMAENYVDYDFECCLNPIPEIGRNLCRISLRKEGHGGYKEDFLTENLSKREKTILMCKTCDGLMKDACISNSGESYCSACERNPNSKTKQIPNLAVREMINLLKCSCPLSERGCKWLGSLEDCENHLDTCGYVYETCELECGVVLRRDELRIHEKEKCLNRIVKCEHCMKDFKSCELNEHLEKCPKLRVPCELCSVETRRDAMTKHLSDDCKEKEIECPFVKYKCLTRIKRKDIDKHLEENETKHLGLKLTAMEDLITKQSEKIDKQSDQINKQSVEISKQSVEINKQSVEIRKQSEENTQLHEKQNIQFQLLHSITDVTTLSWKVENVPIRGRGFSGSRQYQVVGYSFLFKLIQSGEVRIVFPATTIKYVNPFKARFHIALSADKTINCGEVIEVPFKQNYLTRGCERILTYISQEDVEQYSKPEFSGYRNLTLWICLTMM